MNTEFLRYFQLKDKHTITNEDRAGLERLGTSLQKRSKQANDPEESERIYIFQDGDVIIPVSIRAFTVQKLAN